MRGMWQHLERLGGGVGTRGPGESQLESDRRHGAPAGLAAQGHGWRELAKQRDVRRKERRRTEMPTVALAGYTNAGKSTLLNALTGADVSVEDRLFETLDPTTRAFEHDGRPLPRHRHRRLHPPAAAPARGGLRRDARGDARRRPRPARRRRLGSRSERLEEQIAAVDSVLARDRRRRAARRARPEQDRRASTPLGRRRLANRYPGRAADLGPDRRGAGRAARPPGRRASPTASSRVRLLLPYERGRRALRAVRARGADRGARGRRRRACYVRARLSRRELGRFARYLVAEERSTGEPRDRASRSAGCDDDAVVPERAYAGDAGLDLAACERVELAPGERATVGTGLAVAIPEGYAGFVQPRSGLAARHGIAIVNSPGLDRLRLPRRAEGRRS